MPERDEFSFESGLKEDYDGTISAESLFHQMDAGNWALQLIIDADDGDQPSVRLSVGGADKGWTSLDGGETLVNTVNRDARYNGRSSIAQFITAAMEAGAGDELRARSAGLGGLGPYKAALWWGLRFHWDIVEEEQRRRNDLGEWVPTQVQITRPLKYLGTAVAGEGDRGSGGGVDGIGEDDMRTLRILAAQNGDRGRFADAVMKTVGSDGEPMLRNKAIMAKLSDRGFWDELKTV